MSYIKDCMHMASEGVGVYKTLLDEAVGDVPIGCTYVADGIYVGVLTDQEPYRLAFYDFTVSHTPFFIVGESTYNPCGGEFQDGKYFYPFICEALFALLHKLALVRADNLTLPNDKWDWRLSPGVLVGMHHVWQTIKGHGSKTVDKSYWDHKGEVCEIVWSWDEPTDTLMATLEKPSKEGRLLSITYDGKTLGEIPAHWGELLQGNDAYICKVMRQIPFHAGFRPMAKLQGAYLPEGLKSTLLD